MNLTKQREYISDEIQIDSLRYERAGVPITCKAGCGGCCHVQVSVFPEEIDDIMSLGKDIDMDKLESQVNDWNSSDKTCVFLRDGNCVIQDNKPLHCMSHLVNSPAKYCDINSDKPPHMVRVKNVNQRLIELRKENNVLLLHEELYKRLNG